MAHIQRINMDTFLRYNPKITKKTKTQVSYKIKGPNPIQFNKNELKSEVKINSVLNFMNSSIFQKTRQKMRMKEGVDKSSDKDGDFLKKREKCKKDIKEIKRRVRSSNEINITDYKALDRLYSESLTMETESLTTYFGNTDLDHNQKKYGSDEYNTVFAGTTKASYSVFPLFWKLLRDYAILFKNRELERIMNKFVGKEFETSDNFILKLDNGKKLKMTNIKPNFSTSLSNEKSDFLFISPKETKILVKELKKVDLSNLFDLKSKYPFKNPKIKLSNYISGYDFFEELVGHSGGGVPYNTGCLRINLNKKELDNLRKKNIKESKLRLEKNISEFKVKLNGRPPSNWHEPDGIEYKQRILESYYPRDLDKLKRMIKKKESEGEESLREEQKKKLQGLMTRKESIKRLKKSLKAQKINRRNIRSRNYRPDSKEYKEMFEERFMKKLTDKEVRKSLKNEYDGFKMLLQEPVLAFCNYLEGIKDNEFLQVYLGYD